MKKTDIFVKKNRINCIICIVLSALIIVFVIAGLIARVFYPENIVEGSEGINMFRMFTILSNLLVCISASFTIPYTIDGLRNRDYHLPRWIIYLLFAGVFCVSITCLITLLIITPSFGVKFAILDSSNIFLHVLSPICSVVMFTCFNNSHEIKRKMDICALGPFYLYMLIYGIMVFGITEANGGWNDFYRTDALLPWPLVMVLVIIASLILAEILRMAHNNSHRKQKEKIRQYYLTSEEYDYSIIEEAIAHLAEVYKDKGGDLVVPRRTILMLIERYNTAKSPEDCMNCYILCKSVKNCEKIANSCKK